MKIRNPKNRQGITLLFVVSMIVLFLLMGTTFVVISNDYFKAARKRGQAKLHIVDHEAVIRRAFLRCRSWSKLTQSIISVASSRSSFGSVRLRIQSVCNGCL